MSIIIHFTPASTLLSPSTVPPAPACVVDAETALEMGPGLENDSGLSVMSPDDSSMVDVSTTDLYSGKEKLHISGAHHTLSSCFGLPYQDHNYGAPPPPTPPNHSPQMSPVHVVNTVVKTEPVPSLPPTVLHTEEVTEISVTRCVCGFEHDDEYMICCDRCLVWQHVDCMGLDRNKIPETYLCEKCEPRKVDRQKAKVLQAKKKVAMTGKKLIFHETSDESEEDRNEKNQSVESLSKTRSKNSKRKTDDDKEVKMEHAARKGRSNSKQCKERMEIKRSKFRRRTKSKSESACVGDEEAQDAWKCSADWSKRRDDNSGSSSDVHNLGATLRSQTDEMKVSKQLQAQLCRLVEFAGNQKKLVAVTDLSRDQIIIEFKGQFLSATQFHQKNPVYRQKQFPFVLFYKLRSHEELCVDASEYGNEARFVRRSCMPNAEIRHLVSNGALHLYISSIKDIHKDEEITIPFDVNFKDCLHEVDCACNSDMCFISGRKNGGSDSSERKRRTRKHPHSTDDDSNHSLLGSVPSSPVKSSKISPVKVTSPTKVSTPVVGVLPEQSETRMLLDDPLSEEHIKEQRKKMTREERKLDAIMRAFDQMEKAAKRKQQALDRQAQQKALQKSDDLPEKQEPVSSSVIKEEEKQNITENSSSIDDEKPEKPVVVAQPVKHKKGKRRRGSGTPVRRRTRTNSGGSDIFNNTDENTSNCESASLPSTPSVETPESAFSESASTSLTPSPGSVTPVLPKTKRFLHNEWLHEKESNVPVSSPLTVRTEINYNVMVTTPACYVRCTKDSPSASGISAAHLRRSSLAGHGKLASSVGSAKKRWLRQAMYDCEPGDGDSGGISMEVINGEVSSPSHAICFSPTNHCEIGSPGIVAPEDVVTPLKKRRLMRKSVESVSSSEWLGASSELSPDHSSCDSTVDGSAESILAANISVELKCSNSTEKQDEKCSVSGRNGLSQHLLKTLRQNWIKNDNKAKVTDSLNIDENAQNSISDGNVNSVTKNSDPEIKNVTLPGCCSEGNSALKEGDINAKQRDFKSVFEVKDDKSLPNENSVEEGKNAIHSESISVPVLNQESKKKLEFAKGDLSADCTETNSVKIVIPDNLKDKNLSSNATTNVSLSNVPEASNKEPPVAELSVAGSAVLSSLTSSQQLPNSQNKVRTGEGICDSKAMSDCVVKISKEESSVCDSTSNLNLKGKEKDLMNESNDAQDTTYFQKLSSDIDSTSVSIGTTDSSTTVSVPTACASKENLLKLGTVVMNDKDTLGSKLLSPLSTDKISLGENVNESPNKSSSPTSASATPKRKVSLSEYWQRKRENPTNNSGSFEKKKSNNCMLNSMGSLEIASESEIKLASLPLFQSIITSKEQNSTEEGKGTKKKDSTSFGGERKAFLETRENLTERLKREFGLEEETEPTKSDNESKYPKSESGSLKVASDIAPILSLCSQLPPPPPPAPPGGAPVNNKSPSPSQFNYPVATPFAPQPYVISQVNASQYMTAQSPMVPQIIPVIHPMTVSSATQPPCNYSATMQTSVARPPQPTYPVVNNQNYAVLAQPLPHATLQPTYHPLFKSRVYK